MRAAELIEMLEKAPQDALILTTSASGTLIKAHRIGTIRVIPTRQNPNLKPGHEWRVPVNEQDEPDVERKVHFVVS